MEKTILNDKRLCINEETTHQKKIYSLKKNTKLNKLHNCLYKFNAIGKKKWQSSANCRGKERGGIMIRHTLLHKNNTILETVRIYYTLLDKF
jgi:hypothetical protein